MPESNQRRKEKRAERKAAGLCTMCGNRPPKGRGSTCSVCRDYFKKYKNKKESKGICRRCASGVPLPKKKTCETCLKKQRDYVQSLRDEVFTAYGGYVCRCCGETHKEFLQLDHVNNDGSDHRKEVGSAGGDRLYLWLKKNGYPPIIQVLCANCNYSKAHYGYCPHHPHREVNNAPTRRTDN
jgi:hypothetical protein